MASRGEAREHEAKRKPYHKKWICRVVPLSLSFFQASVSFRATIVRFGMTNRFVKDCRVGRTRPPRNDTKLVGFMKKPTSFLIGVFESVAKRRRPYLLTDFDDSGLSGQSEK